MGWFETYVGGAYPKLWCPTAMMAVTKVRIRERPRAFYKMLRDQVGQ